MIDKTNQPPPSHKPPERGSQHYKNLQREITAQRLGETIAAITTPDAPSLTTPTVNAPKTMSPPTSGDEGAGPRRRRLFSITINADLEEGTPMTDPNMLLYMAFKPLVPGLKLNPEQIQLILAHQHEILREALIEEQAIIAEQNAMYLSGQTDSRNDTNSDKDSSCK
jgi:hypothetical protein